MRHQPSRPACIGFDLRRVVFAIEFKDEFPFETDEIHNERPECLLTTKLEPGELSLTNAMPNESFGLCLVGSERAGKITIGVRHRLGSAGVYLVW